MPSIMQEARYRLASFCWIQGNAWTDAAIDNGGAIDFWYSHAIVSEATKNGIHRHCDLASVGPLHAQLTALEASGYTACAPIPVLQHTRARRVCEAQFVRLYS